MRVVKAKSVSEVSDKSQGDHFIVNQSIRNINVNMLVELEMSGISKVVAINLWVS